MPIEVRILITFFGSASCFLYPMRVIYVEVIIFYSHFRAVEGLKIILLRTDYLKRATHVELTMQCYDYHGMNNRDILPMEIPSHRIRKLLLEY